jgi:hypothetical protein
MTFEAPFHCFRFRLSLVKTKFGECPDVSVAAPIRNHPARQGQWPRAGRRSGDAFQVTPQTIRKDLNDLCDQRLLSRIHGGALFPSGIENLEYEARRKIAADEKDAIGQAAARLIPDNASLFVNIGTTTEAVGKALLDHKGLMVITNNINVANRMRVYPDMEVVIAGGVVRGSDGGVVGEAAVDFIRQFKVDYAVIGASAIDHDGALARFRFSRGQGGAGDHRQCAPCHPGVGPDQVRAHRTCAHRASVADGHLHHRPLRHSEHPQDLRRIGCSARRNEKTRAVVSAGPSKPPVVA